MVYSDFTTVLPEVLLALYAMAALLFAVYTSKDALTPVITWATAGVMLALALWVGLSGHAPSVAFGGLFIDDLFARFAKVTILISGADDYEKEVEFDYAPFGITGLEVELALSLMQLVHTKRISLADMIAMFTVNPARLLNLKKGTLSVGADADVTVFDENAEWIFRREDSASKSKNNPFFGWKLKGKPVATIVAGKKVFVEQPELAAV